MFYIWVRFHCLLNICYTNITNIYFYLVAQSCLTLCDPMDCGVCSNSCPLRWWCHPTISSSIVPFSSWPQSCPASGSFPMSWLFSSGGQSIGASALALALPSNEYSGLISFRTDWFDLLAVLGILKSLLQYHSSKASIFSVFSLLYGPTLTSIHDYWKNHSFDYVYLCQPSDISAF